MTQQAKAPKYHYYWNGGKTTAAHISQFFSILTVHQLRRDARESATHTGIATGRNDRLVNGDVTLRCEWR